ncbi:MAG: SMC-Scp complex subunit ScpB, partial [Pseudomonadota bacterium]
MRMVEAMLFASNQPMSVSELSERMPVGSDAAHAVRELEGLYQTRGVQLVRVAGKWAFRTAPDLAFLMRGEVVEQRKLSKAAVETMAVIAYHQPVTRAEIEEIRQVGVSKGTIDLLMELDWVKLGRRRQTPGRPVTFVTTDHFLQKFGLDSLRDLPGLDELRQAGLLDRPSPGGGGSLTPAQAAEAVDEPIDDEALAEAYEAETDAEAAKRRQ